MTYSEIVSNCMNDPNFFFALLLWCAFFVGGFFYLGIAWAKGFLSVLADMPVFFRWLFSRRKKPRP